MMKSMADLLPELIPVAGVGVLVLYVLGTRPKLYLGLLMTCICFVPWWIGVEEKYFFPVVVLVCIMGNLSMAPGILRRLTLGDWGIASLFAICLLPVIVGGSSTAGGFAVLAIWLPCYLIGRRLPARVDVRWIYGCIAVFFSIVSMLALAEFLLTWNPFVHLKGGAGSSYSTWATLQVRGGVLRAEGAFGQAIALGSSIALAIPMTIASRFRTSLRLTGVGLMLAAVVVTFSRGAMICAVLGLVVSMIFIPGAASRRFRYSVIGLVSALSVVVVPLLTSTFSAAGSEATRSADYRGNLTSLLGDLNLFGISDVALRAPDGSLYFNGFRSIDDQLILTGVTYGAVALAVGVVLMLVAVVRALSRRATAPTVAIACQIPVLISVAFITQYAAWFWVVVGLAVATQVGPAPLIDPPPGTDDPDQQVRHNQTPDDRDLVDPPITNAVIVTAAARHPSEENHAIV